MAPFRRRPVLSRPCPARHPGRGSKGGGAPPLLACGVTPRRLPGVPKPPGRGLPQPSPEAPPAGAGVAVARDRGRRFLWDLLAVCLNAPRFGPSRRLPHQWKEAPRTTCRGDFERLPVWIGGVKPPAQPAASWRRAAKRAGLTPPIRTGRAGRCADRHAGTGRPNGPQDRPPAVAPSMRGRQHPGPCVPPPGEPLPRAGPECTRPRAAGARSGGPRGDKSPLACCLAVPPAVPGDRGRGPGHRPDCRDRTDGRPARRAVTAVQARSGTARRASRTPITDPAKRTMGGAATGRSRDQERTRRQSRRSGRAHDGPPAGGGQRKPLAGAPGPGLQAMRAQGGTAALRPLALFAPG